MKQKTTDETENTRFAKKFAVITKDQNPSGPWAHEQPLKPKPKVFDVNDPDMMGG